MATASFALKGGSSLLRFSKTSIRMETVRQAIPTVSLVSQVPLPLSTWIRKSSLRCLLGSTGTSVRLYRLLHQLGLVPSTSANGDPILIQLELTLVFLKA